MFRVAVVFQLMVARMLLSGSLMLMKQMQFLAGSTAGLTGTHIIAGATGQSKT